MHSVRTITPDLLLLGGSDRQLSLFENLYPIPRGVSYNAYLVLDEKTVLLDTADSAVGAHFYENLEHALQGRPLDYVVVNHMEPDHCSTLGAVLRTHPKAQVVASAKAISMIGQFFDANVTDRSLIVKEGDTLSTGRHTFTFALAPMVHWPEVMVTYDATDKILFSADAFGTFGALNGNIFADEVRFESEWLPDARRYYTNIVGKYGPQVQSLLKKAASLDIQMICPLHGPIWRESAGIAWFFEKYQRWSSYTPEDRTAAIFCGSIYGNTENAAEILAARLADKGVKNLALYDVSHTHLSDLVAEAFRCSHLVFASATYNAEIFTPMDTLLRDLKSHGLRNRTAALIENGTWAPVSGKQMAELLGNMKDMTLLDGTVSLKSSVKESQRQDLEALADALAADILGE